MQITCPFVTFVFLVTVIGRENLAKKYVTRVKRAIVVFNPTGRNRRKMVEDRTKELPALGRPMQLGMLYDCRNDTLIPGITLWDPDDLQRDRSVSNKSETYSDVFISDAIDTKFAALDIDGSLKASFMSGLVDVKGSAKYLHESKSSSKKSSLSLHFKTTRRFEQLSMKHLGRHNVKHSHVLQHGTATHVVTGILYGAQAFFVFERENNELEEKKDIEGQLEAMVKEIPYLSVAGGEADVSLDNNVIKAIKEMKCTFYGDFALEKNPTNFNEVVKIYKTLPHMLGDNNENAVPLTIWLYPLTKLDSNAAKLAREISVNLISQTQDIFDCLNQCQSRSQHMKTHVICKDFPQYIEKLNMFADIIKKYKLMLQQNLAKVLPEIRRGGCEEEKLAEILTEHEQTPFSFPDLDSWLKNTEKEMNFVKVKIRMFPSVNVIGKREILDEFIWERPNVVCFCFPFIGHGDEFLNCMSGYTHIPSSSSFQARDKWSKYKCNDFSSKVKGTAIKANSFKDFLEANDQSENIDFAVIGLDDGDEKKNEAAAIFVYEQGILTTNSFQPPGIPEKPVAHHVSHNAVTLSWNEPKTGGSSIEAYLIEYRQQQLGDGGWSEAKTDNKTLQMAIEHLTPNVSYEFRVIAVCSIGVSKCSTTTCKTLPASPPYGLKKYNVTPHSISIHWEKPSSVGQDTFIEKYQINYSSAKNDDDSKLKFMDSTRMQCTLENLKPSTTYSISVSALCGGDGKTGASEPIDVATIATISVIQDIAENSKLVKNGNANEGEPSLYRLPLVEEPLEANNKYCIYRYGSTKKVEVSHRVIMVLGATGAGKSTLIDGMINYILGVDWMDPFRFTIIDEQGEHQSGSDVESQTQHITSYTIQQDERFLLGYTLTIIDTPGFGDTRGIERDKAITEQIQKFFSDSSKHQIDHIDAIGFVAPASLSRLTHTQRYVLDSIMSIFGKDIADNIMLLVTFADGQKPPITEAVKAVGLPCNENMFKFNNSALFANTTECTEDGYSSDTKESQDDNFDKMFWKMGVKSMKRFFSALSKFEPKSLSLTREVLDERKRLGLAIQSLRHQIQIACCKLEELRTEHDILDQHEREINANKDFIYEVDVPKCKMIEISKEYITNCMKCNFSCHYPCSIVDDRKREDCEAIDVYTGKCLVCPGKCPWDLHFNQAYRFEYYIDKEKRTFRELEDRYNEAEGKKLTTEQIIEKHLEEFNDAQNCVLLLITEAHNSIQRIEEIALKPNPLSAAEYVELLIESEQKEGKPGWKGRIKALEDIRKEAEILGKIRKPNFNPLEEITDQYLGEQKEGKSRLGRLWEKLHGKKKEKQNKPKPI